MNTPTHFVTASVDQEQMTSLNLFLMSLGCKFTIDPITEATNPLVAAGFGGPPGPRTFPTPANAQKGLTLRILRAATANGSKGISRQIINQIGDQAGATPALVKSTVQTLVDDGKLVSMGRGNYKRAS